MPAGGLLTGGLIAGGAGALGGATLGAITAGNAQSAAQQAALQAAQQYLSLTVPDPQEQQLILQQYQLTGQMDPRLASAFQQAKSSMGDISVNPADQQAQSDALASLQNIGQSGGETLADKANLNAATTQANAENAGREGAIEQQFGERGMGAPSGLMLSAEEQNNQNATQNENQASLEEAASAQKNALAAIQGAGQLGNQMQNQQFGEAASVAQAKDAVNQFNTQMSQGAENTNVANENAAEAYNTQEKQNISNQNTQVANQQQIANKALTQQQYEDQLQKAGGAAAGYEGEAGQYNTAANTNANMWGNISQGLAKTGAGVAMYGNNKTPGTTPTTGTTDSDSTDEEEEEGE